MTVRVLPWWDNLVKGTENVTIDFILQKYNCVINFKVQKQQERKKISAFLLHEYWGQRVIASGFKPLLLSSYGHIYIYTSL
jgi:hypothetical protein